MQKVPQRTPTDCGICCVAMLLGVSYEAAFQLAFPSGVPNNDSSIQFELLPAILQKGGRNAEILNSFHPSRSGILEISYLREGKTHWHYIAYHHTTRTFIDPQKSPPAQYTQRRFVALM